MRDKKCKDCSKLILRLSTRCQSCAQKERFTRMNTWNKGLSNTWYSSKGLEAGWKAKKELKKMRIKKNCEFCNKRFRVPKCLDRMKYCSRSCASKNLTPTGEGHWNWKGGVTSKNKLDRVKFRKTIQKKVLERDDYTCQMCGSKKNLQVDHIQSWADYVKLRFDINNCRTLCMDCHYEITFGKQKPKHVKIWGHNMSQLERWVS